MPLPRRPHASDVEAFLLTHARAVEVASRHELLATFELPGLALTDHAATPLADGDDVAALAAAQRERHAAAGAASVRPEAVALEHLSDRLCVADVRWRGFDEAGRPLPVRELTSYVLRVGDGGSLRIQVVMELPPRIPPD